MKYFTQILAVVLIVLSSYSAVYGQRFVPLVPDGVDIYSNDIGPNARVEDMIEYNGDLILVGRFESIGGEDISSIAKWNGNEILPFDVPLPSSFVYMDILETPLGLVVSGTITDLSNVLLLNGSSWVSLGSGLENAVYDIIWYQNALYACGNAPNDGVSVVYKFENGNWIPVGEDFNESVCQFKIFENELYVVGDFTACGNSEVNHIAKWNGEEWEQVHNGLDGSAYALEIYEGNLVVGGHFTGTADNASELGKVVLVGESEFTDLPGTEDVEQVGYLFSKGNRLYISNGFVQHNTFANYSNKGFILENEDLVSLPGRLSISKILEYENKSVCITSSYSSEFRWEEEDLSGFCMGFISENGNISEGFHLNSIKTDLIASPGLFHQQFASRANYEITESEAHTIYRAAPWFGAVDESGSKIVSESTFSTEEDSYHMGPKSDLYNSNYLEKYARVWKVSKSEIQNHISDYSNPDYDMPEAIANWPGNGRVELGESEHLAPFIDLNENGWYEPYSGDYPDIAGDLAIFTIFSCTQRSDLGLTEALDLDVGMMFYAVEQSLGELSLTTFLRYHVINTSGQDLTDFKFGFWVDGDLGGIHDDYVGCLPEKDLFFTHNGDAFDVGTTNYPGFGENPPAQGVVFLNNPLESHLYYNIGTGQNGDPQEPIHYWNYLNSTWKNGVPLTFGGDGFQTGNNPDSLVNFMFPGPYTDVTPDDMVWTEITAGNNSGDRRQLGVTALDHLESGGRACFDLALITSFPEDEEDPLADLNKLFDDTDYIQNFYDQNLANCASPIFPLSVNEALTQSAELTLYPNPSRNTFSIAGNLSSEVDLVLLDLEGRKLLEKMAINPNTEIDISSLSGGVYVVSLWKKGVLIGTDRLVKQ